ncbi:hypothetical protein B0T13DRAFT_452632 [Neurospora crassa]|nr:hypothetical protein B0T13DRAFT_452632 [Neurospora crassa]
MKSTCPPPPAVHSYMDLVNFRKTHTDTIFVSIDIENIDHQPHGLPMEKLSEMGVATFDPRDRTSNSEVGQIQAIQVRHMIIDEWAWVTAKTCPNRRRAWHRGAHKPSPYTAMFCISNIQSSQKVMSQLTDYFRILQNQHLTETEVADGIRRKVVVLSWDSNAESQLFNDHVYNFTSINHIEHWDFQLWLPVLHRFGHRNKTGAERFYATTGVLGLGNCSIMLHNASNDAWAQVATLIRFFHMSKEEFSHWVQAEEDLKPLDLSWVDLQILHHNAALEHKYKRFPNHNGLSGVSLAMHPDLPGQAMSRNGHRGTSKGHMGRQIERATSIQTKESREIGKGLGTEIPKRLETKPAPKSCWSVPLSFGSSSPSPSSATTSPNQSTPASTPSSSLLSASVSRNPPPPTPATNYNAPASSSTATIVNNGSNDFLSPHESASVRDHGAAGPAKEDGQCLSRNVPKRKKRGKKKSQVVWEL